MQHPPPQGIEICRVGNVLCRRHARQGRRATVAAAVHARPPAAAADGGPRQRAAAALLQPAAQQLLLQHARGQRGCRRVRGRGCAAAGCGSRGSGCGGCLRRREAREAGCQLRLLLLPAGSPAGAGQARRCRLLAERAKLLLLLRLLRMLLLLRQPGVREAAGDGAAAARCWLLLQRRLGRRQGSVVGADASGLEGAGLEGSRGEGLLLVAGRGGGLQQRQRQGAGRGEPRSETSSQGSTGRWEKRGSTAHCT